MSKSQTQELTRHAFDTASYMSDRVARAAHNGLDTLRDLPDFEALEDAGLLSKEKLLAGDILLP